jgi:signal transduction histidine kinase
MSEEQEVGDRTFLTTCEPLPPRTVRWSSSSSRPRHHREERGQAALMRAKQEAERADRLKSQFLSVMSHETAHR